MYNVEDIIAALNRDLSVFDLQVLEFLLYKNNTKKSLQCVCAGDFFTPNKAEKQDLLDFKDAILHLSRPIIFETDNEVVLISWIPPQCLVGMRWDGNPETIWYYKFDGRILPAILMERNKKQLIRGNPA